MLIETERLTLREFVAGDWPAVLAYRSDPRYLRCYDRTGRTAAEARDFSAACSSAGRARSRARAASW